MVIHSMGGGGERYERGTKINGRDGNFKLVRDGLLKKVTLLLSSESIKDDPWRYARAKEQVQRP